MLVEGRAFVTLLNACKAPGSIEDVRASWLIGNILPPKASDVLSLGRVGSNMLDGDEDIDGVRRDEGTTGGSAKVSLYCHPSPYS